MIFIVWRLIGVMLFAILFTSICFFVLEPKDKRKACKLAFVGSFLCFFSTILAPIVLIYFIRFLQH